MSIYSIGQPIVVKILSWNSFSLLELKKNIGSLCKWIKHIIDRDSLCWSNTYLKCQENNLPPNAIMRSTLQFLPHLFLLFQPKAFQADLIIQVFSNIRTLTLQVARVNTAILRLLVHRLSRLNTLNLKVHTVGLADIAFILEVTKDLRQLSLTVGAVDAIVSSDYHILSNFRGTVKWNNLKLDFGYQNEACMSILAAQAYKFVGACGVLKCLEVSSYNEQLQDSLLQRVRHPNNLTQLQLVISNPLAKSNLLQYTQLQKLVLTCCWDGKLRNSHCKLIANAFPLLDTLVLGAEPYCENFITWKGIKILFEALPNLSSFDIFPDGWEVYLPYAMQRFASSVTIPVRDDEGNRKWCTFLANSAKYEIISRVQLEVKAGRVSVANPNNLPGWKTTACLLLALFVFGSLTLGVLWLSLQELRKWFNY